MRGILFAIILFISITANAVNYVTVVDDCPVITFTSPTLQKVSVYKNQLKVQMAADKVIVTFISDGSQIITWDVVQADAYGYTIDQLYNYILSLITTKC